MWQADTITVVPHCHFIISWISSFNQYIYISKWWEYGFIYINALVYSHCSVSVHLHFSKRGYDMDLAHVSTAIRPAKFIILVELDILDMIQILIWAAGGWKKNACDLNQYLREKGEARSRFINHKFTYNIYCHIKIQSI